MQEGVDFSNRPWKSVPVGTMGESVVVGGRYGQQAVCSVSGNSIRRNEGNSKLCEKAPDMYLLLVDAYDILTNAGIDNATTYEISKLLKSME